MVNVVIAGVPKNIKISKFIEFMERKIFLEKIKVSVNYIRWYKYDSKKLSLNMRSNDARKAIRYLNGYEYVARQTNYSLGCWKEGAEDRSDNDDVFEPPPKMTRTSSPFNELDELQVIDRKIELIRKQRILLEEESQLLLEKKRLEMIQNLGPNDFHKLCKLEEMRQSIEPLSVKGKFSKPHDFKGPWKIIYEEMKAVINAYVDEHDHPIFIDLLRSRVKNRLALALTGEGYLTVKEIVALYRSIHPIETDVSLVQEVLMKINQSIYPITTDFNVGEENEEINPTDEIYYDSEGDEKTGLNYCYNEEMAFYEDVNPDGDNHIKHYIQTPQELGSDRNKYEEKNINDENIPKIKCETNITETDCGIDIKETNKNECQETESNKTSQEKHLNMKTETGINESELASDTNNKIETALNEAFDMENDLDDWIEDEKDDQQKIKAVV